MDRGNEFHKPAEFSITQVSAHKAALLGLKQFLATESPLKMMKDISGFFCFFFNWYSLHARLNSHYEAWSYKRRKHKKVKAYRKSI